MTREDWLTQLEECGGDLSQDELINLVFKDGPNALWSDVVKEMHVATDGMYSYLNGMFPSRVWNDWQGTTELGTRYHSAYVPFDLSIFQRSMQICTPGDANECHTDYCSIPRGGISHLPELEMYKTGFKTEPLCIANIRTSRQAKQIAELIIKERFNTDEQVMNMFYTLAVIRMLGHKWILEYETDVDGNLVPKVNTNPRNMLQGYDFSYMQPLFPQVSNLDMVMPLDMRFLDSFGRALTNSRNPNFIAKGQRGVPIFELWHAEDWYRTEILDNPEYKDMMKFTMPSSMLLGYSLDTGGEKEIIGNFNLKQMPNIPRFTESTEGGLTIVQPYVNVRVDSGNEAIHNFREWDNAPFLLTVALGKGVGEILSRPSMSTGIEGRPIMPITGNGDWNYRNDYDKECNEDLNMPHFRKRFEMGFRLLNPDAGWGFISRAKKFKLRPINSCDLRPIFAKRPLASDCSILQIGCNPNNKRVSNNIITENHSPTILCQAAMCGKDTIYRLQFSRESIQSITPDQNPLGDCGCGDSVQLALADADGSVSTDPLVVGTLVEYIRPNMIHGAIWFVELDAPLAEGQCITGVFCEDATANVATVIECIDDETDPYIGTLRVRFILDSLPSATSGVGDAVTLTYYDADGVSLGTKAGTIAEIDLDKFIIEVTSVAANFGCIMYDDQVTIKVTLT